MSDKRCSAQAAAAEGPGGPELLARSEHVIRQSQLLRPSPSCGRRERGRAPWPVLSPRLTCCSEALPLERTGSGAQHALVELEHAAVSDRVAGQSQVELLPLMHSVASSRAPLVAACRGSTGSGVPNEPKCAWIRIVGALFVFTVLWPLCELRTYPATTHSAHPTIASPPSTLGRGSTRASRSAYRLYVRYIVYGLAE